MQATGQSSTTLLMPMPWWRLPMAGAVALHGRVLQRCQLCHSNFCQPLPIEAVQVGCYDHWFNRLRFLCASCHNGVTWQAAHFQLDATDANGQPIQGVASVPYTYPFDTVMRQFKNSQQLTAILPLLHALRQLAPPAGCRPHNSVIVPVPTTTERIRERGFAPVFWLSLYLSFHWQIPLFLGVSRDERRHQQGLDREQRLLNLQGAFELHDMPTVKRLIVFDDVVTTGATLSNIVDLFSCDITYRLTAISVMHGH